MTTSDWAIPQQAKLKYTQLFNHHDRGRNGFLSGLQCRDILVQSGLPRKLLAEIWNLSDIDGDGQLTREEFILAMHLTNQVRAGNQLPLELPPDLVPPSYRKTRSMSAVSFQSATSSSVSVGSNVPATHSLNNDETLGVSSAAVTSSVLNTNTFEDKRRENFEKGKAELERRRLKMFESQISVLNEQLVTSKEQVAEAKAKIDAMRSDRDTKAGLITSLEAQLQTVRDRKAFLQQEEQNLIAIAKDLNLVKSAHSIELDQQACLVKQETIKRTKEKLIELQRERDEKVKELEQFNSRLDESKKEFTKISQEVSKVYQDYNEKLAKAKVVKEQLSEDERLKPINLDAAWGQAPESFASRHESTSEQPSVASSEIPGVPTDDPWITSSVSSQATKTSSNEPFAFTTNENISSNNFDNCKSNNNQIDGGFEQLHNYGSLSDSCQQQALRTDAIKYRALYAFEARNPDELTINPGDIIIGSEAVCEPGWLSGEMNGRSGLFPEAYVEPLPNEPSPESIQTSVASAHGQYIDSLSSEAREQTNVLQEERTQPVKYKAIYAFDARNPDEITIHPDDIIVGIDGPHEPGWLMGERDGKRGLFPESYVEKLVSAIVSSDQQQSSEHTSGTLRRGGSSGSLRSKKSRTKRAEVATVVANYRALGQEQLNLEKGQLVMIRRKIDSGWWEGELQIKGKKKQVGWFPSSYVKLL